MRMKLLGYIVNIVGLFLLLSACGGGGGEMAPASWEGFITRLGNDTLAVEEFSVSGNEATAKVLLRSPRTTIQEYTMTMDDNGMMQTLESTTINPQTDSVTGTSKLYWDGDSLRYESVNGDQERTGSVVAPKEVLPFIDMVHWPFDIMLERAYQHDGLTEQPLVSGTRVMTFELNKLSADSMTVKHPTRGTMGTSVNSDGEMTFLEASQTTRALTVERTSDLDFDALASDFAARDAAGNNFGALSGRGEADVNVLGANILIDYGTPSKRGREIWGGLISYGALWRTGANRATHFKTDKDLMFGELEVPAGEYTLFTIPKEDGGTLIINKQTGQNGQQYDEEQDLGRVPLEARDLDHVVEVFTITAEEEDGTGMLKLQWDDKELVTKFTVK